MSHYSPRSETHDMFWGVAAHCSPATPGVCMWANVHFHTTKIRDRLSPGQAHTLCKMMIPVYVLCDLDKWRRKRNELFRGDWEANGSQLLWPGNGSCPHSASEQLCPCLILVWKSCGSAACQDHLSCCYCWDDQFSFSVKLSHKKETPNCSQ